MNLKRVKHPSSIPPPIHDCDAVGVAFDWLGGKLAGSLIPTLRFFVLKPNPQRVGSHLTWSKNGK
jgi:hypothetical protein